MKTFQLNALLFCLLTIFHSNNSVAQAPARANTHPLPPQYKIHTDGSVSLRVCFNASCAGQQTMLYSAEEMASVAAQMKICANKAGESNRFSLIQRLRIGVWQMELLAKKHYPPLANDLPVNDQEFGVEGRTDCVDNATNTTTFLKVLLELGYLQGWQIIEPKVRKPWDINRVHWTAAVRDSSNKTWSVDSWFRRHGHLPFVMPLSNWQREELAWEGPHQQLNPYPKNVADLCP